MGAAAFRQRANQQGLIAEQQETRLGMTLGGQFQTVEHHVGRAVPSHGVDRQSVQTGQDRTLAGRCRTAWPLLP